MIEIGINHVVRMKGTYRKSVWKKFCEVVRQSIIRFEAETTDGDNEFPICICRNSKINFFVNERNGYERMRKAQILIADLSSEPPCTQEVAGSILTSGTGICAFFILS